MASKESKRPCGAARAGAAGGGGLARPRHAPAKGANWRAEQGAGPGARLGARLQGPTRDAAAERRAPSTSGAGRGAAGWAPFPPSPSSGGAPSGALGPRAEAVFAAGKRARRLPRARADASGSRPSSGGFWNPPDYGCRRQLRGSGGLSWWGMEGAARWLCATRGFASPGGS